MANTKNFKVNSGIQPTVYHENVGTASTGSTTVGYNMSEMDTVVSESNITNPTGVNGFDTGNSGTVLFMVTNNATGDRVSTYTMSTAYDLSTLTPTGDYINVASQENAPNGIALKPDGTSFYIVGSGSDLVLQYNMTTAFDVSTASYASKSMSVTSQDQVPYDVNFSPDGTRCYVSGGVGTSIYQYELTTAWDISTGSYTGKSFNTSTQTSSPYAFSFNSDGTKWIIVNPSTYVLYEMEMSTAWDISTSSATGTTFTYPVQRTQVAFSDDGSYVYSYGNPGADYYAHDSAITLATKTLDMSTGTVFDLTPTANTRIGLSNPASSGTVSQATLLVAAGNTGFNLTGATNSGQSWAFSSNGSGPLSYNNDGTKLYVMDWSTGPVREYTLSTAYDISTASLNYTWTPTAYSGAAYRGMSMCRSGTRLYLMDDNSGTSSFIIRQFNLSTAFDLSTASTSQNSSVTRSETSTAYGMANDETFTNIYIIKNDKTILQYALGGSSDVSAITYTGSTLYSGLTSTPRQGALSSDGTKLLITGQNAQLDMLTFSTAYDSTTGTVTTYAMTTAGLPSANYYGLAASPDLSYATVAEVNNQVIYNLLLNPLATITYDSSIQWPSGTAPTSPASGETDVVTFTTRDGGTTYQGILAIDGAK